MIVGTGNVGASIGYCLINQRTAATELILTDINTADAEGEARPDCGRRYALPVEAVHERREERTGEAAPGDTHHLGDECRRVEGQSDGDDDEDGDQHTHDDELRLLAHILQAEEAVALVMQQLPLVCRPSVQGLPECQLHLVPILRQCLRLVVGMKAHRPSRIIGGTHHYLHQRTRPANGRK